MDLTDKVEFSTKDEHIFLIPKQVKHAWAIIIFSWDSYV